MQCESCTRLVTHPLDIYLFLLILFPIIAIGMLVNRMEQPGAVLRRAESSLLGESMVTAYQFLVASAIMLSFTSLFVIARIYASFKRRKGFWIDGMGLTYFMSWQLANNFLRDCGHCRPLPCCACRRRLLSGCKAPDRSIISSREDVECK